MRCRSRLFKSSKLWSFWNSWKCCWCFRNLVDMVKYSQYFVDFSTSKRRLLGIFEPTVKFPLSGWYLIIFGHKLHNEVTADKSCYTPQKPNMSSKRKYIFQLPTIDFQGTKKIVGFPVFPSPTPLRFPQRWHQPDHHQADHHQSPHHLRDVSVQPLGRDVEGQWKDPRPFKKKTAPVTWSYFKNPERLDTKKNSSDPPWMCFFSHSHLGQVECNLLRNWSRPDTVPPKKGSKCGG